MSARTTQPPNHPTNRESPAVRDYLVVALVGLVLLALALVLMGKGWWCLLPLSWGALGLLTSLGAFPPLLMVSVALLELVRYLPYGLRVRPPADLLTDLLLAVGLLVYLIGHYRLASLVRHITPSDARRARGAEDHDGNRDPRSVRAGEPGLLVVGVALSVASGYVAWLYLGLAQMDPYLGLPPTIWATMLVVWAAVSFVVVFVSLLGYVSWHLASREECLLYLQDLVWAGTRGEQRRIQSWLAWARKRAQRKKEGR